jgi:hypothetical protein
VLVAPLLMVQSQAQNKKKTLVVYDYKGAAMLAAPLLYCTNVLFTLLVCNVLAHFFTFTIKFSPSLQIDIGFIAAI